MASTLHHLNISSDIWASSMGFPLYHVHTPSIIQGVSDHLASLSTPGIVFWSVSLFYHLLDVCGWEWLEQYRVQPASDILKKNLATKQQVIEAVLKMQVMQIILPYTFAHFFGTGDLPVNLPAELREMTGLITRWSVKIFGEDKTAQIMSENGALLTYYAYWWASPIIQMALAMCILDTYQYFVHRALHEVPFLYKHVHSTHHRLYVPYAYGSQYNHPFEGIIVDTLGPTIATLLTNTSHRQNILFFAIITYKAVEDHCGYQFPWHPLRFLTSSNTEFHEIHHQVAGLKYNYSSPLFTFWDRVLGTYITIEQLEAKKGRRKIKAT